MQPTWAGGHAGCRGHLPEHRLHPHPRTLLEVLCDSEVSVVIEFITVFMMYSLERRIHLDNKLQLILNISLKSSGLYPSGWRSGIRFPIQEGEH